MTLYRLTVTDWAIKDMYDHLIMRNQFFYSNAIADQYNHSLRARSMRHTQASNNIIVVY